MKFKVSDLRQVKWPGKFYILNVYLQVDKKDVRSIEDFLRYENKKSPFVSWFVASSTTRSKSAFRHQVLNQKKGRPKTIVDGEKVPQHVHVGLVGNSSNSANSTAERVKKSINKR